MKCVVAAMLLVAALPVSAQTAPAQILVSASGTARTPPDMVTVGFTLRGEGATSDEATTRLRDKAAAVSAGVAGLLRRNQQVRTSSFSIAEVRAKECDAASYGPPRLSTGACAVVGYVASMPVTIDTPRVADAGTLVGLIGRLGGADASIRNFWLRDNTVARQQAMRSALDSARSQATLIAEGSGARLGPLIRVQDADYREVTLELATEPQAVGAPPAPPPPPPPIRIDLFPDPIQTTVRLMAAYGIVR